MKKTLLAGAMLAGLLASTPAWASASPDEAPPPVLQVPPQAGGDMAIFEEAHRSYDAGDYRGASAALERFMATPAYRQMPAQGRPLMRGLYLETLFRSGRAKEAYPELKSLTDADTNGAIWTIRLEAAVTLGEYADGLKCLAVLSERWPAAFSRLGDEYIFYVLGLSRNVKALRPQRIEALLAIYESKWAPKEPFTNLDGQHLELIQGLMEEGRMDKAREIAAKITDPAAITSMRVARRFDAVISPAHSQADLASLADNYTQTLRDKVGNAPDKLAGPIALAASLYRRAQLKEALTVIDEAIERATPKDGSASPFSDMNNLTWAYDRKARILLVLGRGDEAVAAMQAGAALQENGNDNISQQLNLAEFYATLGRPRDALAAAGRVGDAHVSGYGRMDREGVRVEAFVQMHDQAALKASLDYMRAHEDDAPFWLFEALLVSGDEEAAARNLIKLLKDPSRQAAALNELLDYVIPDTAPDWTKMRRTRLRTLRERADIKAAVASAGGRMLSLPFVDEAP
jgi:tetratricopeptide (TPR) repeat protein